MKRQSINETFMRVAYILSNRATCGRRKVGAVLVNDKNHIIATGYNGTARGRDHCIDKPCPGVTVKPGMGHDVCEAIHAEQNALLQCRDVYAIEKCYTTTAPCNACVKLLLNTSCKEIVFDEPYPYHSEAQSMWERAGRVWTQHMEEL